MASHGALAATVLLVGGVTDAIDGIVPALGDDAIATIVVLAVSLSLPCFLYGAWLMIVHDPVTWRVLRTHLAVVGLGLALTTVPLVWWMIPKLWSQVSGFAVVHAFLGLQSYAFFALAGTGIVRILRAKWASEAYRRSSSFDLDDLEAETGDLDLGHWRARLRIGVVGYTLLWVLAFLTGVVRYAIKYQPLG